MADSGSGIRWKQRFQNYEKAYHLLEQAVQIKELSEIERAGLIQFFEMTFELAWKLMKDYLSSEGFVIKTPRQAIRQAFQSDIITEGRVWLEALSDRNLTVHTYEEATAGKVQQDINEVYFPLLKQLYLFFREKA